MDSFVLRFIQASLIWLGVGVVLGGSMAFFPYEAIAYRPAHVHANLLGFVSMMIFGVAYHVVPRFVGHPLHNSLLASTHLLLANVGLASLVAGWILRVEQHAIGNGLVHLGAGASGVGAFLFIYNIWRTLGYARLSVSGRPLPMSPVKPR